MVGRRGVRRAPRDYAADGAAWPDTPTDGPPEAEAARLIALRLGEAIGGHSLRAVARDAGLDHTTLSAVLAGRRWPDLVTVVRLERALNCDLWPRHGET